MSATGSAERGARSAERPPEGGTPNRETERLREKMAGASVDGLRADALRCDHAVNNYREDALRRGLTGRELSQLQRWATRRDLALAELGRRPRPAPPGGAA